MYIIIIDNFNFLDVIVIKNVSEFFLFFIFYVSM